MILILDNFDSFVYNLSMYVEELNLPVKVMRNTCSLYEIADLAPSHIIISPGPKDPIHAGITLQAIEAFHRKIPLLGVCLGHQAIVQAMGGKIIRAPLAVHGKQDKIQHIGTDLFANLPNTMLVGRYHSLIASKKHFPKNLKISAHNAEGIIMAVQHRQFPTFGVQFHPESILTEHGHSLLKNFLTYQN